VEAETVERLRADLTRAMKGRDRTAVRALRSALAAISNAEAPPIERVPEAVHGGPNEHAPLRLSSSDIERILQAEVDDRRDTIAQIGPHGHTEQVQELQAEIGVLQAYLG
jgi:uncharacterized protein YqeY